MIDMMTLKIAIKPDLGFQSNGEITIKRSSTLNNAFTLKSNGIFLDQSLISSGEGFIDQNGDGLRIGYLGPFDSKSGSTYPSPGRISANNIVHRTFTTQTASGAPITWRSVDVVLPGDITRYPVGDDTYEYLLVTNTTTGSSSNGFVDNQVLDVVSLGTW